MSKESAAITGAVQVPDSVVTIPNSGEKHHGIPTAVFFDDVASLAVKNTATGLIDKLSALSQKYRFFEEKLLKSRDTLGEKIAEVQRALKAVTSLEEKSTRSGDNSSDIETQFELSDGIYVQAVVPPSRAVCLWLGANIMVEYSYKEAITLLTKNLGSAQTNLAETNADISYLRDQLNTTDINLSRVYNHHVQSVRKAAAQGSASKTAIGAAT
ncbi:unnamed protein product [Chondrus crispus]|uniref:Prefoldin subunit 3 n=1 Tax=Chondrus crispus TaxID=2769 RepID=R7QFV6_CHOCR|nr:unnamed protein product [Chondrus crispus]CDF36305.1 unnamed protein product [Chondrus crispus]|eukprot:XP_005716124.1 unnamed protein product [Chondrus crispus]